LGVVTNWRVCAGVRVTRTVDQPSSSPSVAGAGAPASVPAIRRVADTATDDRRGSRCPLLDRPSPGGHLSLIPWGRLIHGSANGLPRPPWERDVQLDRRTLLASGLAAGALLAVDPRQVLARPLGTGGGPGADRRSALLPGLHLVHADLHNHSHLSDGTGDAAVVHARLRAAGIDVAALTDHTVAAFAFDRDVCAPVPDVVGQRNECRSLFGLNDAGWQRSTALAAAADSPARYVALPGFEWSSPYLGHMNIWFAEDWIDGLQTGGLTADGLARVGIPLELLEFQLRSEFGELMTDAEITALVTAIRDSEPAGMRRLYDWLLRRPGQGSLGGGADALAGFNHPNREPDAFDNFAYDARVADRLVSLELFNRREDYLFKNLAAGLPSPLVACLNAGWRAGIIGVTDEHGTAWGSEQGKGRAGVWLRGAHRRGVREALLARRVFATREAGLRLAATAGGVPMGGAIPARRHVVRFELDLDLGPERTGLPVAVQVLRPGSDVPDVVDVVDATAGQPLRLSVPLDPADGDWVVLRVSDPSRPNDAPAPFDHACNDWGLAYSSPWWFDSAQPGRSPAQLTPRPANRPALAAPWWTHSH
jgi:hypothetical protein